jgi:beta-N-acetylhexosaminidase
MTDDLSMRALTGSFATRTARAIAAGCDLILHCNGDPAEMAEIAAAVPPLAGEARRRADAALARRGARADADLAALEAEFATLTGRTHA